MKFFVTQMVTQLSYFFGERQTRQNLSALLKYLLFLGVVIGIYTVLFHVIMLYVEEREYSWITGLYWTLTTMSTLGFGDITFHSDMGRLFSVIVLLSGIVLLLIMLPFAFIRYFYAPWLEAQIRSQVPREVPPDSTGHVVICHCDSITSNLIKKLSLNHIPYYVIEPDPAVAARMFDEGVAVVTGEVDNRVTYERLRATEARLIFANLDDQTNTNVILTVREVAPDVPIVAIAEHTESIDILELSGVTYVLPLKQRLGENLANRINVSGGGAHVIGSSNGMLLAEFPVHLTPFSGRTVSETGLREKTGTSLIGVWEHGHLQPATAESRLSDHSAAVVIGSEAQVAALDNLLMTTGIHSAPVVVIGGGKVGRVVGRALKRKGIAVHMVERQERLRPRLSNITDHVVIGNAADRKVLVSAGLEQASSVVLTTNDDATNIYLSIYCRRLNPKLYIVTRITHARNVEAMHRAGADVVLSYASLGSEMVFALLQGRDPVTLGAGIDLFRVNLPPKLVGKTLAQSEIGALTGLTVIGIQDGETIVTTPPASITLTAGSQLLMLGTSEQLQAFTERFPEEK